MDPLEAKLSDVTEQILSDYAKQGYLALQQPARTAPAAQGAAPVPIQGDEYIKALNLTSEEGQVMGGGIDGKLVGSNYWKWVAFANAVHEISEHGKDWTTLPGWPTPWPHYDTVDLAKFDLWWTVTNLGGTDPSRAVNGDIPKFFVVPAAPLPAIVILPADGKTSPPQSDGPIGPAVPNNPGVFTSSGNDSYPDGYMYVGKTGIYQKHIYSNPFTADETRVIWIQL